MKVIDLANLENVKFNPTIKAVLNSICGYETKKLPKGSYAVTYNQVRMVVTFIPNQDIKELYYIKETLMDDVLTDKNDIELSRRFYEKMDLLLGKWN